MTDTMMTPWCERCDRAEDLHHSDDGCDGFVPMTLVEHQRRARIAERRTMALYYAWGREDMGDRRLRDAASERVLVLDFASFAAAECEKYVRERTCSLASVADQYARFVGAVTIGTRFVCDATGDVYGVDAYMGNANEVFASVVDGPHGCPATVPIGGRISFTPNVLAGYRLVTS